MTRRRSTAWILLALVVFFTVLGIWFARREDRAREEALAPTPIASETEKEATVLAEPEADSTERVEAVKAAPSTSNVEAVAPAPKPAGTRVEGRVLDISGIPVAGAPVLAQTRDYLIAPKLAVSATDGSFQFTSARDELLLIASNASWRTLRAQVWRADRPRAGFIVVAPCIILKGEVVEQTGVGLPKARITVEASPTILAQFPFDLDGTAVPQEWNQGVDRDGTFTLNGAISTPGTKLEVECEEFVSRTIPMPADPSAFLRVVLERDPNVLERTIRGFVVRHDGEPATNATVRFGEKQAATDAHGAFELPCTLEPGGRRMPWEEEWTELSPLVAVEAGSQAAIVPEFGRVVKASPRDPPPQKLFLGPPPLSISGRVLDGRRQPLAGYTVTLLDPTLIPSRVFPEPAVEQLTHPEAKEVVTNEQGAFELGGLFARSYRLQVFSNKTLGRLESAEIPAGSRDVELVFPPDAFVPEVTGRVVGRDGVGIGGVKIVLVVQSWRIVSPNGEGGIQSGSDQATTAADGSFRVENFPRSAVELRVKGTGLLERAIALKDLDLEHPLVIQVDRACKFRIDGLPASKDKLHLLALDAQQQELRVTRSPNSNYGSTNRLELGDDPAETYTVAEAAVELVLYANDGTILGRRPARLVPGSVGVVTW